MRALLLLCLALVAAPVAAQTFPQLPVVQSTFSGTGTSTSTGSAATTIAQPTRLLLTIGDSKTAPSGIPAMGQWQDPLVASLALSSGGAWTYVNRGVGSRTVASTLASIGSVLDASIVPPTGRPPAAVLINLGVNDSLDPLLSQVEWTTNFLAILDAIRGRWPTAPIYFMRWWARDGTPGLGELENETWLPAMMAQRTNLWLGPDERIWMKGSDDGATNTYDGTHQSVAGHFATAAAWKAVLWP